MRDVFQIISLVCGFWIIVEVVLRTRRTGERMIEWLPIVVIGIGAVLFYISVFIDQHFDIMNSSDVSSTVRLISEIMLIIFIRYFTGRIKTR